MRNFIYELQKKQNTDKKTPRSRREDVRASMTDYTETENVCQPLSLYVRCRSALLKSTISDIAEKISVDNLRLRLILCFIAYTPRNNSRSVCLTTIWLNMLTSL